MDAHALLKSQGWRGSGHSLHKTDDSIGLAKPILASRKNNTLGIGRKNHVTSDQWWLNALDEQLKSLDTSNKTSIVQTKTNPTKLEGLLTHGAGKYTGANALYACFVSGGMLQGTIKTEPEAESTDTTPEAEVRPAREETKEERKARREERRRKKAAKAEKLSRQTVAATKVLETEGSKIISKSETKSKEKSKKKDGSKDKKDTTRTETKEERRARKASKRKEKAAKDAKKKIEKG